MISPETLLRIFLILVWVVVFLYLLRSVWVSLNRRKIRKALEESIERINTYENENLDISIIQDMLGDRQKWVNKFWVFNPFKLTNDLPFILTLLKKSRDIAKENNL